MATKKLDYFKQLRKGKYDWQVQARVLNLWRGFSKTGEAFKAFNLLLLDGQRGRIHAFVPGSVAESLEKVVEVGKIYYIQNFTVKDYKAEDKFRCIRKDIQIVFGEDTVMKPMDEKFVNIEQAWFDFYDLGDLKQLANQYTYLTDVIGVMEDYNPIGRVKNRNGQIQSQIKFKITDGRTTVAVTFWDEFAESFADVLTGEFEHPIILIVGSARITKWQDEVIISHVGATTFYVNYNHHSVAKLRKMVSQPLFSQHNLSTPKNRSRRIYKLKHIRDMDQSNIESEVISKITVTSVDQVKGWCSTICTSCYAETILSDNDDKCSKCHRILPYADKWFQLYLTAKDETDTIQLMVEDREVRSMIGKYAYELINEGNKEDCWPVCWNEIVGKDYTVKIHIGEANVVNKDEVYVASDIMEGFGMENINESGQQSYPHPISDSEPSASVTTVNLASFGQ